MRFYSFTLCYNDYLDVNFKELEAFGVNDLMTMISAREFSDWLIDRFAEDGQGLREH